jgi:hypothetical protein
LRRLGVHGGVSQRSLAPAAKVAKSVHFRRTDCFKAGSAFSPRLFHPRDLGRAT